MSSFNIAKRSVINCISITAFVTAIFLFFSAADAHAITTVNLRTADSFAVLAGSGITNTNPTTITGDVGSYPTTTQVGFSDVTLHGTNRGGNMVTQGAKDDLATAYVEASASTPVTATNVELGGTTKTPGTYGNTTLEITGTLTLDGQNNPNAMFIFLTDSTLITASNSSVSLINNANPCNVFWRVASSATLGTNSSLVGTVMADQSITATSGASVQGRLLAQNAAVTLDNNVIDNLGCSQGSLPTTTSTTATTAASSSTPIASTSTTTRSSNGIAGVTSTTSGSTANGASSDAATTGLDSGGASTGLAFTGLNPMAATFGTICLMVGVSLQVISRRMKKTLFLSNASRCSD